MSQLRIWGISATIGNLEESMEVLLGNNAAKGVMIKSNLQKQIEVISIIPDEMDTFPWAGHLGTKLIDKVLPIIHQAKTTLVFTNTRAQTEIWYQALLNAMPDLAGSMAMHHGSINNDLRYWVEQQLHTGELKVVVCTSSLDLGVDFRPVEQVIQVGGPKGIARFLQRAGRSGHQPGAKSKIYFLPTHAIELMEASAMRKAISLQKMESKIPVIRAFDVLCQYLVSLAVGDGLDDKKVYQEVKSTYCFNSITDDEWDWVMHFITQGGKSLYAYDEFKKVELDTDGKYRVLNKRIALRHRLSIGVIVSDPSIEVKYMSGSRLGTVEEYFISKMKPGDVFTFAGKSLEIVQFKDLSVLVRKVNRKGAIASWQGGRLPLSNKLSEMLREGISEYQNGAERDTEYAAVDRVLSFQQKRSLLPTKQELLIEKLQSKEGYHVFVYPFEGRNVHEGLSGLMAYRISRQLPISFSIAFNDYGFELLSDQPIPIENALEEDVFSENDLIADMMHSINSMEMAKRKFRDIANIAGLIFTGFPGKNMKTKHLQASSSMFFKVLSEHEPDNLLVKQAYEEVLLDQLEELRLRETLKRIGQQQIRLVELSQPSPFAFPIMVDRLREKMSSETIEDRVKKMQIKLMKS
jgi:ATP-dependent Lhr-like helicase